MIILKSILLAMVGMSITMQTVVAEYPRQEYLLDTGWMFVRADVKGAHLLATDTSAWERVRVPHDWAITGPFDQEIDKQVVEIAQNNEAKATEKTGRTGALPFIGAGWYRYEIELPKLEQGRQAVLQFDGAMSEAQVYVNGTKVGEIVLEVRGKGRPHQQMLLQATPDN